MLIGVTSWDARALRRSGEVTWEGRPRNNILDRVLRTILERVEIHLPISEIGRDPSLVVNVAGTDLQTQRDVFKLAVSTTQSLNFLEDLEGDLQMHH